MPQPTASELHVDTALSTLAVAYKQDVKNFIADQVFPVVQVEKQSDKIIKFDKSYWMRVVARTRPPATESAGGGFEVSADDTYFADIHAIHKDVADATLKNSDIDKLEQQVVEWVTQQLLLEREYNWMQAFFNDTGKTPGTDFWTVLTGGTDFTQWSDASSDPVADINNAIITVAKSTGLRPNILVLSPDVYMALKSNAKIKDLVAYSPGKADVTPLVTPDMLAKIWDLDKVLVSWATFTQSAEGASTTTYDFILGKHALLVYAPPNPGLLIPTGGYIFEWTGYGAGFSPAITNFYIQELRATRYEGEMAYDMKILGPDLGVFFKNAVA